MMWRIWQNGETYKLNAGICLVNLPYCQFAKEYVKKTCGDSVRQLYDSVLLTDQHLAKAANMLCKAKGMEEGFWGVVNDCG